MPSRFLISRRDRQSRGTIPVFLLLTALRARARSAVRFLGIVNPIVVSNLRVSSPDIVTVKYFPLWRIVGIIENLSRAIETCFANLPLAVVREMTAKQVSIALLRFSIDRKSTRLNSSH